MSKLQDCCNEPSTCSQSQMMEDSIALQFSLPARDADSGPCQLVHAPDFLLPKLIVPVQENIRSLKHRITQQRHIPIHRGFQLVLSHFGNGACGHMVHQLPHQRGMQPYLQNDSQIVTCDCLNMHAFSMLTPHPWRDFTASKVESSTLLRECVVRACMSASMKNAFALLSDCAFRIVTNGSMMPNRCPKCNLPDGRIPVKMLTPI